MTMSNPMNTWNRKAPLRLRASAASRPLTLAASIMPLALAQLWGCDSDDSTPSTDSSVVDAAPESGATDAQAAEDAAPMDAITEVATGDATAAPDANSDGGAAMGDANPDGGAAVVDANSGEAAVVDANPDGGAGVPDASDADAAADASLVTDASLGEAADAEDVDSGLDGTVEPGPDDGGPDSAARDAADASSESSGDAQPTEGGGPDCGCDTGLACSLNSCVKPVSITAGQFFTCALLSNETVGCWGSSEFGQMGNGLGGRFATPVIVPNLTGVTALSAGMGFVCAALKDGSVSCWGQDDSGQLGSPATYTCSGVPCIPTPSPVPNLTGVTAVGAGSDSACALLSDGTVECWGSNASGQLGNGSTMSASSSPVPVYGLSSATAIAVGSEFACALLADKTVTCWGDALGTGGSSVPVPINSVSVSNAIGITAAAPLIEGFACAWMSDGTAECWGSNGFGQLGSTGAQNFDTGPVAVSGLTNAAQVSAGGYHACALRGGGSVACWGQDTYDELGAVAAAGCSNGLTSTPCSNSMLAVPSISNAVALAAGTTHTCALLASGAIECWGDNTGWELGTTTTSSVCDNTACSLTPVTVQW